MNTEHTVSAEQSGQRLDRFLVEVTPGLSRARARAMLDAGQVRVDGRRVRKGEALVEGARVEVSGDVPPQDFTPVAEGADTLVVRLEDAHVVVVDKAAGVATHPLRPDETGTLANALVARYPEMAAVGFHKREPGLLHRLDTDTSGLVLAARTPEAFEALRAASSSDRLEKRYLALVEGRLAGEGVVELPLVPHRKDPKRVEVVTEHVRLRAAVKPHPALTRWRVARALGEYTLVEASVTRAFRHQVRAHLASIGHPLVGDALYRGPALPDDVAQGFTRHGLHASEIHFPHPLTGAETRVVSPLPADFAAVIHRLRDA